MTSWSSTTARKPLDLSISRWEICLLKSRNLDFDWLIACWWKLIAILFFSWWLTSWLILGGSAPECNPNQFNVKDDHSTSTNTEELGTVSLVHLWTSISTNIPLLCCLLLFQIHIHFTCSTRPIGESVHMWSWEFSFSVLGNRGRPKRKTMTLDKAVYKYAETGERWKTKNLL